ncbi:MAG: DUF3552 domain-containing protein, partial [Frankiales bacterium]|nr:DUF3552 domain-containing protein [Frankiales bacterium]
MPAASRARRRGGDAMTALVIVVVIVGLLVVALVVLLLKVMARMNAAPAAPLPGAAPGGTTAAGLTAGNREDLAAARAAAEREAKTLREDAERQAADIRRKAELDAAELRQQAEADASAATREARQSAESELASLRSEARTLKEEIHELKSDLERREQRIVEREERIDAEQRRVEARDRELAEHEQALERRKAELADVEEERRRELERVAGLTAADAKAELVKTIETQAKREAAIIVRDIHQEAKDEGETRARKIVTLAIQRVASEQTAESVVSVLHLPSDDMKGRIIGREGRNIRAFESTTGVNLIIDDTPEAVLLSCFDPVRREVGRLTLEKLVLDGRIPPHRIEEIYERSKAEVEQLCVRAGEDALVDVGLTDMHPELITLLGQLRYRTSYGQNVLKHLIESAHIAGMMASELRLDPVLMKRCTVLHDIG